MVNLFSTFGKLVGARPATPTETAEPLAPAALDGTVAVFSPIGGRVIDLVDVPDPVFGQGILGDGLAIDPTETTLKAPCDGEIAAIHDARHAVTLRLVNGAEMLMHIGIETVALGGKGFTTHIRTGQRVRRGDPLVTFDRATVARHATSMLIPIVLTSEGHHVTGKTPNRGMADGVPLFHVGPADVREASEPAPWNGRTGEREPDECRATFRVGDPTGIHARPAGLIAEYARQHDAKIIFSANGKQANARSPVNLMLLGLSAGDTVAVTVIGGGDDILDEMRRLVEGPARQEAPLMDSPAADAPPLATPHPGQPWAPDAHGVIKGVQAVSGLAAGAVRHVFRQRLQVTEQGEGVQAETCRLETALAACQDALQNAIEESRASNRQQAEILKAHLSFLHDPDLIDSARNLIDQGKSAGFAWECATGQQAAALKRLGNARLAERATDLMDLEQRVLSALAGESGTVTAFPASTIVVADDLLPSQLIGMDTAHIAGICLAEGGPTSHVAILAASLGIPTLVAMGPDILRLPEGVSAILDADHQRLEINPSAEDEVQTVTRIEHRRNRLEEAKARAAEECRTADGERVEVAVNLASPSDVLMAVTNGAEGCGLLRSEFLFLDRATAPSEDEQLAQYQAVADALGGRPLVIRTLDAGADKVLPYLDLGREENPALGRRGVRVSLWKPDTLRVQLRAILRVQPNSPVHIMVPMIATVDEVRKVRVILDEESHALGVTARIPLGIMVEVPSVAITADVFARECDFFSIGTNDLTQYTLAMDRMNAHLAHQADALEPAVLRLVGMAATAASVHGRWTSVCGGLASMPLAAPLLIGLGVRKLSATASTIPEIKAIVRTVTMAQCREIAGQVLNLESAEAVRALLRHHWPEA